MANVRISTVKWKDALDSEIGKARCEQTRNEGVPLLRTLPGFISYAGLGVDSHTTVNVYTWDSEEHCKSGIQQFREWVNRAGLGAQIASIESTEGEVLVSS